MQRLVHPFANLPLTPLFHYGIYGISLKSEIPLALPEHDGDAHASIELRHGGSGQFEEAINRANLVAREDGYCYSRLNDSSSYVCWTGLGEFIVSPRGDRVWCSRAGEASNESFQVYLLGQALSFALVKAGFEPLHATAIEHEGDAIALLGDSGYGKSTLAASLIAVGWRLLTDDLLLLRPHSRGLQAYAGPARIKLFPDSASRFLGCASPGVPMNAETTKQVIPLDAARHCPNPVPLRAIYALASPQEMRRQRSVRIDPMTAREAFFALVKNTFNRRIADPERLQRQISQTTCVLNAVPVRKLSYPRSLARLSDVREAILSDNRLPCTKPA
jgi:hypothetical protein